MQSKYITRLGVVALNQWAMDFDNNLKNIVESIKLAKEKGCTYRLGPELEICGYSCEDHFLEIDTTTHCWEAVAEILKTDLTDNIIVDLGMPVIHKNVFYNCRVVCCNRRIYLIRPKMCMADDGNYHESRWFTPWQKIGVEDFVLPEFIQEVTKQKTVPIGVAIMRTEDTEIGVEICEELWVPQPSSTEQALDGAEIIVNSSGSYFQLNKIPKRAELILDITKRNGGVYLFSNLRGCDGSKYLHQAIKFQDRLYFDGSSLIACNGSIWKTSELFSLKNVELIYTDVDLQDVRNHRINFRARSLQAARQEHFHRIDIPIKMVLTLLNDISQTQIHDFVELHASIKLQELHLPEEVQLSNATGCYLWDYLRRSGANGFLLPLSGGADSAASATCVFHMCNNLFRQIDIVLNELRTVVRDQTFTPASPQDIVNKLFVTVYMGSTNSSSESKARSQQLAKVYNSVHYEVEIDEIFHAFKNCIKPLFPKQPEFQAHGGQTYQEDLALQNIQARSRMVLAYLVAQLAPWSNGKQGFLLVLGSSNLDESLRGYVTKYDCSSADVNPLGSLTKNNIRKLLAYTANTFNVPVLNEILGCQPSAELRPTAEDQKKQVSENEMGLTFDELENFGKLRKIQKLGPFSMLRRLIPTWKKLTPEEVNKKVKFFFTYYAINRHKCVVLPPSFHAEEHSNDDNRYDFRQFLYNYRWPWQFRKMDEYINQYKPHV